MDHPLQLSLGHHPGVFSIKVFSGGHFFPAGGKDECPVVKDLFLTPMTNLCLIVPILLFESKNLCLGIEVDGSIAFHLFDESTQKVLRIGSLQRIKGFL